MKYILGYAACMGLFVSLLEFRKKQTADRFLVANHVMGGVVGAMSIAVSWIWAPALLVSTKIGYEWGYAGLAWFVVPNMLALAVFAPFAARVRRRLPTGYSYIDSIADLGGGFPQAQFVLQLIMQVAIFALQVTAGAEVLHLFTGSSYVSLAFLFALIPVSYSLCSGIRSTLLANAVQYFVILVCIGVVLALFPSGQASAGVSLSRSGGLFKPQMLREIGVASAVSLLFAIFADHQQWQRAFSIREDKILSSYLRGGALHGIVTCSLGTLGVLIARAGFVSTNAQLVGGEFIHTHMSNVAGVAFIVMVLCGLCTTIDSAACAFGSLYSTRVSRSENKLKVSRLSMVVLAFVGFTLAAVRLPIVTLWLLCGTIRLATFAPTLMSIVSPRFQGVHGTWAIAVGIAVGGSIFGWGLVTKNAFLHTAGIVSTLGISSSITFASWLLRRRLHTKSRVASQVVA